MAMIMLQSLVIALSLTTGEGHLKVCMLSLEEGAIKPVTSGIRAVNKFSYIAS